MDEEEDIRKLVEKVGFDPRIAMPNDSIINFIQFYDDWSKNPALAMSRFYKEIFILHEAILAKFYYHKNLRV